MPFQDASPPVSTLQRDDWVAIVDDDDSSRRSLIRVLRVLRVAGIRVESFHSAEEYLQRRGCAPPGCLVLDIHLGGISGLELRDRLAAEGWVPPIVFITGHDEIPAERITRHVVPCDLLRKPLDAADLLAIVGRHLRRQPSSTPTS